MQVTTFKGSAYSDAGFPLPVENGKSLQQIKFDLHRELLTKIDLEAISQLPQARMLAEVRAAVSHLIETQKIPINHGEREMLISDVADEVFGLGPLEALMRDNTISDILVTTPKLVYVERAGKLERTAVEFRDNAHLLRIIEKIVARVGRRVDESSAMVDARLPDGSRINAVVPPIAVDGPLLSIRRFGTEKKTAESLVKNFTWTEGMAELLKACVSARLNILIAGGTGAGKTTLLNILSSFISEDERIVTIEDAAELQLRQTHVARLETRPENVEGNGAVSIRQLVINALRMRPDRIIVGEVRGAEAVDMMQAMNTGHDGSLTTIHANNPRDAVSRLEVMMGMANANMGLKSIRQQIVSAIDLFVHVQRSSDGSRRVTHITECLGMEGEIVTLQDVFVFEKQGMVNGRVTGRFRATGVRPKFMETLELAGFRFPPNMFQTTVEIR